MKKTTASWLPALSSSLLLSSAIAFSFYLRFFFGIWPPAGYIDETPFYILLWLLLALSISAIPWWLILVAMKSFRPKKWTVISQLAFYWAGWFGLYFYLKIDPWGAYAWWFD
jgi:hypothetical protein